MQFLTTLSLFLGAFGIAEAAHKNTTPDGKHYTGRVRFFTDPNCAPDSRTGEYHIGYGFGHQRSESFPGNAEPRCMKVYGDFVVLLKHRHDQIFDQKTDAYCSSYHTRHGTVDDGCHIQNDHEYQVRIDTGSQVGSFQILDNTDSPGDTPCRNYQQRSNCPVPPGNCLCAQR